MRPVHFHISFVLSVAGTWIGLPTELSAQACPVIRQNDGVRVEVSSGSPLIDYFLADPKERTIDVRLIGVYVDTAYIDDAGSELAVPLDQIYRWTKLCRGDPIWDGALWGAGTGLAVAATIDLMLTSIITAYTASERFWTAGSRPYVVLGLSGALIGAGWDWLTPDWVEATLGRQAYLGEPYQLAPPGRPFFHGRGAIAGMAIGGGAGLVAGLISGPSLFEGGESCSGSGSNETCHTTTAGEARTAGVLLFGLGGALVGAALGSWIARASDTETALSLGPVLSPVSRDVAWGVSASIAWPPTR